MGLPELTFSLQKAATTAANRATHGIVALILRDANANGVYTIYRESDIPAGLTAANHAYCQRALIGYLLAPFCLFVAVIATDATIDAGFTALRGYSYDYLCGPEDISAEDATTLATLVTSARHGRYIGKAVLPATAGDDAGIINFSATDIQVGASTFTAAQYASRIAGILAGTPTYASATYASLAEITAITADANPDTAIAAGKLILVDDGRQVKLGRAVTSKVTLSATESDALKKIKLVSALDIIRYYAVATVEEDYLGKCANSYDNKCILLTALREYLTTLETEGVLQSGTGGAELDADAIRSYLLTQANGDAEETARLSALEDNALRKEDTGSHVFLRLYGRLQDAMEDFHITLNAE